MKKNAQKTKLDSKKVSTKSIFIIRLILAAYILVILLSQLFTFEKFPSLLTSIGLNIFWANMVAILLVTVEVLALPFLLNMKLLQSFKRLSAGAVLLSLVLLLCIEAAALFSGYTVFLGATFDLPNGTWSVTLLVALIILAIWALFGDKISKDVEKNKKATDPKIKTKPKSGPRK